MKMQMTKIILLRASSNTTIQQRKLTNLNEMEIYRKKITA